MRFFNALVKLCVLILFPVLLFSGDDFSLRKSAASLGSGGMGLPGIYDLLYNPSFAGSEKRIGIFAGYSAQSGMKSPFGSAVFPFSRGVLAFSFQRNDSADVDFNRDIFSASLSKELYSYLRLGLSADFASVKGDEKGMFGGGTFGISGDIPFVWRPFSDVGIFDPRIALAARMGKSFGDNPDSADMRMYDASASFSFIKTGSAETALGANAQYLPASSMLPYGVGLSWTYRDVFTLRGGALFEKKTAYDGFTSGAGINISGASYDFMVDYAFVKSGDIQHNVSLTVKYGSVDTEPPHVALRAEPAFISPNFDGRNDYTVFAIKIEDSSEIKGWNFAITRADGSPVKEYRSGDRDTGDQFAAAGILKRLFASRSSYRVPSRILWDGTDSKGAMCPDGEYNYSFMAWDANDNYSVKRTGAIVLDNTAPLSEISAADLLFSPNGDKNKDELVIKQKVAGGRDDVWKGVICAADGKPVKSFVWKTDSVPSSFKWDGRNDAGEDVPEGLYKYQLESTDSSLNGSLSEIKEISLMRSYEQADVSCGVKYYSYRLAGPVLFSTFLSKTAGLRSWSLVVENSDAEIVRSFSGTDTLPAGVEWDGRDSNGAVLPDGQYYYSFRAEFVSGNTPSSYRKSFIVDSTAPSLKLKFDPPVFSPDNDGESDVMFLRPFCDENFASDRWEITIYNPRGFAFRKYSGNGKVPSEIVWDGMSQSGELVESAEDYSVEYRVSDMAGNQSVLKGVKLPVDILVVVTERGLKIKISNIEFAYGSDRMLGKATSILDRVSSILEKYSSYSVIVEGHTDDIGEDSYNLKLSEMRARAVYEYLIGCGVSKESLSFRGMGETVPYLPNKDEESRRKNRRVEFLLEKNTGAR